MEKTAILFGSTTGNTETIAREIAEKIDGDIEIINVTDADVSVFSEYSNLILGTSTWGVGDLQDDWEEFLPNLSGADLNGKVVALFGLGDASGYPDSFVDGIGTIYNAIKDKGCTIVGEIETTGYKYDASTAVIDGNFVGLPIDEDGEGHLTAKRISSWVEKIAPLFN